MNWKRLGKALLFPHIAVLVTLIPISAVLLVGSMVFIGVESPIAIISYVIAAYTLTVWCFKIPHIVKFFKSLKAENKYLKIWFNDARLRVKVSLYSTLAWSALYGIFQLWLGLYHQTFWFSSIGVYYLCLAAMRFYLVKHTRRYAPCEREREELIRFRACGCIFLLMNLALAVIVIFMIYWNRTFEHHMITAIAMAAYTFTALIFAIVNLVKYRKYNSPVFTASKAISLAAAIVSLLTLESTMLTTFGDGTRASEQKLMLGLTGGAVSLVIVAMAIYMIVQGTRKLKKLKTEVENGK